MTRGFCFAAAVALTVSAAGTVSAQKVSLKVKFVEGRKSTMVVHTKTEQTLTLVGMDLESGSDQTLTISTVNGKRADDGTLKVTSKIDAVKAAVTLPGGTELEFDSAQPDADPPGTQFDFVLDIFKATAKSKWTATITPDNRIASIDGRDAAFGDLPQNLQDAMKSQLDPEYLKQAANDEIDRLPTEPVAKGDSWERTTLMRLDSGQKLEFTTKYTYEGPVQEGGKELHKINVKTTSVDYSADADAPLKVLESDLSVANSEGYMLFDAEAGQATKHEASMQLKGSLKLEVMGMELPGTLDLKMENSHTLK